MSSSKETKQARNAKIVEQIAAGDKTYEEVASEHGLTRGRIDQILTSEPGGPEARDRHKELKRQGKFDVLKAAIKEKLNYREIAEQYGKDQSYWRNWADKLGISDQIYTASKQSADRRKEIMAYLDEGHTQKEAAEKFNTTQVNISAIAVRNGMRRRYTGDELARRNEKIAEDLKKGMTYAEASEKYNLSYASIYNAARFGGAVSTRDTTAIKERNENIASKLKAGIPVADIASEDNVSVYVVYNIARELGISTGKSRMTGSAKSKRDKELLKKYAAGASATELAEEYGLSVHTIYGLASSTGTKHSTKAKKSRPTGSTKRAQKQRRNEKMIADYENGETYQQIAYNYKVSISTVYQVLRKAGKVGKRN